MLLNYTWPPGAFKAADSMKGLEERSPQSSAHLLLTALQPEAQLVISKTSVMPEEGTFSGGKRPANDKLLFCGPSP